MRQDCFTNLNPSKLILINRTYNISGIYLYAVDELNRIITAIYVALW